MPHGDASSGGFALFRARLARRRSKRSDAEGRLPGGLVAASRYALAIGLTAVVLLAASRFGGPPAHPTLLVFVLPVLAAACLGGTGPGLLATALAVAAAGALPAIHGSKVALAANHAELAWLAVVGVAISLALRSVRRRRERMEVARQRSRNVLARQLRASAEQARATRFQRFTRDAPIGIVLTSSDGRLQFANDEYLRIVGSSREELESEDGHSPLVTWLDAGAEDRCEKEFVRRDGSRVPVLVGVSRQPDGFAAFVIDLTAEKQAQQGRRESEERFRTLADNIAQLAWIADSEGHIVWHNQRWFDYAGAVPERMAGAAWQSAVHPAHGERVAASIQRCLATGETWEETFPLRASDGRYRWFLSRAVPIRGEDGRVLRWFGTSTDVTELHEAQEVLKEADRRKSDFMSVLSHELRNPLAPIRNSVYVLGHCDPGSEAGRRARAVIARQVDHLTRLVDDLLDVTRIARGKIELRRVSMSLNELVRRSGEDHRVMLRERGLQFSVKLPQREVWVEGDATRLSQVVRNLLQNAAKFSKDGGRVTLELVAGDAWAEIRVGDDGAGIDPELLDKLFEPFVQAERTMARSQGGLGLGLALVKGLVGLHGGTVHAASDGLGKGSEFVVRLPTVAAGLRPAEDRRRAPAAHVRSVRVLVVEDNHDVAESLAQVVELLGHDVEIARDGPAALAKAHESPPDIVLCDIGLPGMSGFDVARAFRADPELRRVRLVAVTGYAQPEDRREAAEAGFERHVAKPADPEEIEQLLGM
jgi:PAS domain S-box-containing protein